MALSTLAGESWHTYELVAVCCSVLQCVAKEPKDLGGSLDTGGWVIAHITELQCVVVWCSVLQCVAVCCSALQCVPDTPAGGSSHILGLKCVAVHRTALQCVAVCCNGT